ncbi:hypothetical protein GCM10009801_46340 [Streptomyces albiaxialis]|uniref:Uncharacterized protein n=1 Tax=Streptomyces albiaxialis TaxID=329523 RepID=A0ABP5HXJ5_9ACTN
MATSVREGDNNDQPRPQDEHEALRERVRQLNRDSCEDRSGKRGEAMFLLMNPGECCRCGLRVTRRALIAIIETGSGPGGSAYACLPCAREYATTPLAPEWLPDTIREAAGEARGAGEGGLTSC